MQPTAQVARAAGEPPVPPSRWLVAVTLAASYAIGANAAVALHECGHALGGWAAGGKMLGLVLGPQGFSGSYAARDLSVGFTSSRGYLMEIAGGCGFGAVFGLLLLVAARWLPRGSAIWIIVSAAGVWSIGNNGAYLLLGSIVPFDDALFLLEEGVPRWLLFLVGLPLVVAFVPLFARFLLGIGLRETDPFLRWLYVVEVGLLAYLLPMLDLSVFWTILRHQPLGSGTGILLIATPIVPLLLGSAAYAARHISASSAPAPLAPRWSTALTVLAVGVLFMAAEVLFFSYDFEAAAMAKS